MGRDTFHQIRLLKWNKTSKEKAQRVIDQHVSGEQ